MYNYPNKKGFFGKFGGSYMPDIVYKNLKKIENKYIKIKKNGFLSKVYKKIKSFFHRPTPIYYAKTLSNKIGKSNIFFKREDLNFTNSHKINNTIGQIMLAKKMKKKIIVAETGAGQHGLSIASVASCFKFKCIIFMGYKDYKRQIHNYRKIKLLGAMVKVVKSGSMDLNESIKKAFKFHINNKDSYYLIGSVVGPHPYPMIVRDFQSIIGKECVMQKQEMFNKDPDFVIACIGGGSNAMGIFYEYILRKKKTKLIGVEAVGNKKKNSVFKYGNIGIFHGSKTLVLKNNKGFLKQIDTISSGLNFPSVGPEHAMLLKKKLAFYKQVKNKEALIAFKTLIKREGIIPSIESSHAIYYAMKLAKKYRNKKKNILVNLSGAGEKDILNI
ncbi:tryptophan synthase subunit beta [Candidatus Vidania fulgoroideorum]